MSCLDVMYQVLGAQPYFTSYTPYHHHHHHHHQQLASDAKTMQESGRPPAIKEEEEEDKEPPPGAQYLSARCVLFTYFHGDIGAVVDQHFSRALSLQASSVKTPKDGWFPMSQRNFPPSFWNGSYASGVPSSLAGALSAPHSELAPFAAGEPYGPPSLHGHPDAWHPYSLGAQGSAYARHEVYGAAFDPRYGSLLVPSVRPHHRPATGGSPCDPGGKGESAVAWSGTFSGEIGVNADSGMPTQDKSKDLYWF
ncbi:transcription cofactor vestigial-like protein 2a [Corythoichthys intestinalis]|uniref:transcription cofactor vestigial-like protein 2a n=1 Tax=Corythoichthys intestinalis TaxID=161448 RepID=UPI0025A6448B|nr:transcription cofactor vestigial-like protein 2a [Corythoichthys intestinalis]